MLGLADATTAFWLAAPATDPLSEGAFFDTDGAGLDDFGTAAATPVKVFAAVAAGRGNAPPSAGFVPAVFGPTVLCLALGSGGEDGGRLGLGGGVDSRFAWIGRGGLGGLDGDVPAGRGTTIPRSVGLLEARPGALEARGGGTLLDRAGGALDGRGGGVDAGRAVGGGFDQLSPGSRVAAPPAGLGDKDGGRAEFRDGALGRDEGPPADFAAAGGDFAAPIGVPGTETRLSRVSTFSPGDGDRLDNLPGRTALGRGISKPDLGATLSRLAGSLVALCCRTVESLEARVLSGRLALMSSRVIGRA